MDSGMDKPHTAMQTYTKHKKYDESEKENGHNCMCTLIGINQNRMSFTCRHMQL